MQELIEKYQKDADKVGPLKLGGFTLIEDNTKDFIRNFLFKYNKTCTTENQSGAVTCWPEKRRSAQDIYCITKNYFPKTTLEEVIDILIDLLFENNKDSKAFLYGGYCIDVCRTVFQTWAAGNPYSFETWHNYYPKVLFNRASYGDRGLNPVFLSKIQTRLY